MLLLGKPASEGLRSRPSGPLASSRDPHTGSFKVRIFPRAGGPADSGVITKRNSFKSVELNICRSEPKHSDSVRENPSAHVDVDRSLFLTEDRKSETAGMVDTDHSSETCSVRRTGSSR